MMESEIIYANNHTFITSFCVESVLIQNSNGQPLWLSEIRDNNDNLLEKFIDIDQKFSRIKAVQWLKSRYAIQDNVSALYPSRLSCGDCKGLGSLKLKERA